MWGGVCGEECVGRSVCVMVADGICTGSEQSVTTVDSQPGPPLGMASSISGAGGPPFWYTVWVGREWWCAGAHA